MSRSTTHPLPRESVWPSSAPSSDHLGYLEDCITATEGCLTTLSNCLGRLNPGISDLPRLTKILKGEHVSWSRPLMNRCTLQQVIDPTRRIASWFWFCFCLTGTSVVNQVLTCIAFPRLARPNYQNAPHQPIRIARSADQSIDGPSRRSRRTRTR